MTEPTQGPHVRWRSGGHELEADSAVVRFEVTDLNRVIARAVADGALYRSIQDVQGHPRDWQVLPMSCFAATEEWPPERLADETGFTRYRVARASALAIAGYTLWPTEVFIDAVPDPRNDVHYDLLVAAGPGLVAPRLIDGTPSERRAARAELAPLFERALAVLGEPRELDRGPDEGSVDANRMGR